MKLRQMIVVLGFLCAALIPFSLASADCSTADAPPNQTFECAGTDTDGVNTGGGNDTVNLNGETVDTTALVNTIGIQNTGDLSVNMDNGTIQSSGDGIDATGGVTVNMENGNILADGRGIDAGGNSTIHMNNATIKSGGEGLTIAGHVEITGSGQIRTTGVQSDGIDALNITNSTNVYTRDARADALDSDGNFVVNSGNLETDGNFSNGINAAGNVTNQGNIQIDGSFGTGIITQGNVSNSGDIQLNGGTLYGIVAGGDVNHIGTINTTNAGNVGIAEVLSSNSQTITVHGGTISGANTSIDAGGGNDQVTISIDSTITGNINGGANTDTLTFTGTTTNQTEWDQLQAMTGCAPGCNGTVSINGKTFTYSNFENLVNLVTLIIQQQGSAETPAEIVITPNATPSENGAGSTELICQNEAVKVFRTLDGFLQVYSGFQLFPNGFLVATFHHSDAQHGDIFRLNDPTYPPWYVEIGEQGKILVKNQNGQLINDVCRVQ